MNNGSEHTCGTCKHWHKQHQRGVVDLSQQNGECREQLHASVIPTAQGLVTNAFYPSIPAAFPCCSHYQPMVVRTVELSE
jgi:hypothetical protein